MIYNVSGTLGQGDTHLLPVATLPILPAAPLYFDTSGKFIGGGCRRTLARAPCLGSLCVI